MKESYRENLASRSGRFCGRLVPRELTDKDLHYQVFPQIQGRPQIFFDFIHFPIIPESLQK
jgi:hypothetical protein